ncbi:unnamed protein product [Prunus armeniaca]|uniref:Uncharacterized protein n=1 Tax=Prunus armeniaca TaxID=36596 RepID=A0A6J5TTW8_PRUAR|nr:hypothetical protein GBA52_001375 [Prunus armeniaca]CAB4266425.1 unnamed protein product [Prunus armeniaca]CAB4296984.1 unnamed protein product [Prunus armeniaca]
MNDGGGSSGRSASGGRSSQTPASARAPVPPRGAVMKKIVSDMLKPFAASSS